MIFDIPVHSFVMIILCSFLAGIVGTVCVLLTASLVKKSKFAKASGNEKAFRDEAVGWQRITRDEQLYNGR